MIRQYLLASDFDQTLSFNDSGVVLSELIGFHAFHDKVQGLSNMNLVQQGAELSYLILHDPEFRHVRREHLIYGKILATCAFMTLSLSLTVSAFATVLQFAGLERFGMSVNFGPLVALTVIVFCLPLVPLGAALMTIVAAFTRSYREAQTYLGLVLLVPTLPLVFAGVLGLRPTAGLMAVPSLSQHFLITSLLRDEPIPGGFLALSVGVTLAVGAILVFIAGRLYHREALLG